MVLKQKYHSSRPTVMVMKQNVEFKTISHGLEYKITNFKTVLHGLE